MKHRYSINKNNQLLISDYPRKKSVVVDGEFCVDKNNHFLYWLNEPTAWRRKYNFPPKVILEGNWRLSPNYDLMLFLDKTTSQFKDNCLLLKADIISANSDALIFEMKSIDKRGQNHIQLLKLRGIWQADQYNRLIFQVKKDTSPDILTLDGAWQLNKNQQITYTYQKSGLKKKDVSSRVLTFSGFWRISERDRLTYIISEGAGSRFDFKVQLESPNVYPKEGVIKYRLGAGFKELKKDSGQVISLYGVWKFSRALGLIFQIEYLKGEIHALEFSAEVNFNKNNEIVFQLKNETDEDLGISLIFTHRFLRQLDAQAFLRLKAEQGEASVDVGVRIPF